MDPAFRADFDPLAIFWCLVGLSGFAAMAIAFLLIAYCLLYPTAARYAARDSMSRDQFFDWQRASTKGK